MTFRTPHRRGRALHLARAAIAALGVAALALTACTAAPQEPDPSSDPVASGGAEQCEALAGTTVADVTITGVTYFAAGDPGIEAGFCQVSGHRDPLLDIEVDLPDTWSGRYFQQGGGNFNGKIRSAVTVNDAGDVERVHPAITTHNAIYAASNGGNRADVPEEAAPGLWAQDTDVARASLRDYAFGSLWTTMQFGKGLAERYYGSAPERSYFNGCSNGGREARIIAQRWPTEFDGIVAGCEGGDTGRQVAAWLAFGSRNGTPAEVSPEQYSAAYAAAIEACDSDDGLEDGYLANPAACDFDPAELSCAATADAPLCLTPEQLSTFQSLLSPMTDADGEVIYEAFNWTDFSAFAPLFGMLGGGFAMVATGDTSWTTPEGQASFTLEDDFAEISLGLLQLGADHNREEIASYVAEGGHLLLWHAAGDGLLSPREHGRTFADLQDRLERLGIEDPAANTMFLQVPTNRHAAGSTPQEVDWFTAIIDWVEHDTAPTSLVYTFEDEDGARSLPVCEYPQYPAYVSGDERDAASFECRQN